MLKIFNFHSVFQPNIRDKLTSLEATVTYSLPEMKRKDPDSLTPVLKPTEDAGLITRDTINIQKDCGGDNVCIPDLQISYSRYYNTHYLPDNR